MLHTDWQALLTLAQASRGVLVMVCGVLLAAAAAAQQPTPEQAGAIRQACRGDYGAHCSGVPTGGAAALDCLKRQAAQLSAACRAALQPVMAAPAAGAATSSTARRPQCHGGHDSADRHLAAHRHRRGWHGRHLSAAGDGLARAAHAGHAHRHGGDARGRDGSVVWNCGGRLRLHRRLCDTLSDADGAAAECRRSFRLPTPRRRSASKRRSAPRSLRWVRARFRSTWCC